METVQSGQAPLRVICLLGDDAWQSRELRIQFRGFLEKCLGQSIAPVFVRQMPAIDSVLAEDITQGIIPKFFVTDFVLFDYDYSSILSRKTLELIFEETEILALQEMQIATQPGERSSPDFFMFGSLGYFAVVPNTAYCKPAEPGFFSRLRRGLTGQIV